MCYVGDDGEMARVRIPESLGWWRDQPGGAEWLARLPSIVAACAERWTLDLAEPLPEGSISLVVPGRRADGAPTVLKVNFPDAESEQEGAALLTWKGDGAARLLAEAPEHRALLIERLVPGRQLWDEPDEIRANEVAATVLRRLWRPLTAAAPFRWLGDVAHQWHGVLPERWERWGRPFDRELVDEALRWIDRLVPSMPDPVLVHQDVHGGNLLYDEQRGWLAIDPKPLAGEPAFDTASLLRDRRGTLMADPAAGARVRARLDQLAALLELDRERMRGWGIVHALAWCDDGGRCDASMVACARWLAEA